MPLTRIPEIDAVPRTDFQGISLPVRFSSLAQECHYVRDGAGLYDASFRSWVRMTGEDRVDFLQGMVSNDVKALQPGQSVYATLLTQQGKMVSDLRVYAATDHFVLDFPAHAAAAARAALERFIVADDVEMAADGAVLMGLEGPACEAILGSVAAGLTAAHLVDVDLGGIAARLAPAGHAGEVGVLLAVAAENAAALWKRVREAGAEPVGFEALDVLRVEAGIPWVGVDMDEETLVMEADLESAISFKKGCYLGQEVVERIAARGHVNRRRAGLVLRGDPVERGTPLLAGDKEVGRVTSCVRSPRLAKTIGMGYVRREHLEPGSVLSVEGGGAALVAALPFYKRG